MLYRLGQFQPGPESHFVAALARLHLGEAAPRSLRLLLLTRALRHWGSTTAMAFGSSSQELPDLLDELRRSAHPDEPIARAIHAELVELQERLSVRLLACEHEPGRDGLLSITAASSLMASEVRVGDVVEAGFVALRDSESALRISPRIYRLACSNGAVARAQGLEGEVTDLAGVGLAIRRCFDPEFFAEVANRLAETTRRTGTSPRDFLNEMSHLVDAHGDEASEWLEDAEGLLQDEPDPTDWDVLNAFTQVARELQDWRQRFDLEEAAGRWAMRKRTDPRPGRELRATLSEA